MGTSKHSGAIALFDREFVKSGIFAKDLSLTLHKTFDMRQEADYEEEAVIEEPDAQEALDRARGFVDEVRRYMRSA